MPVKNALLIRAAALLWLASLGTLAACGGSSTAATVGVDVGVILTAPSGTTLVEEGSTLEIDAAVAGDVNNEGVVWTLSGVGSLTSQTNSVAIYQAPSGVVGAAFATLTAIAVHDNTQYASVTITVNGTPAILPVVVFPANQNVGYTTYISGAGGTAPYAWSLSSGTFPPGLAFDGSTAATTAITGIPTTLGTSTFTILLTDALGLTASTTVTMTVNPPASCLLQGRYAYMLSGFANYQALTRAGSFSVDNGGILTGIFDLKSGAKTWPATPITLGSCVTLTQNRGQMHMDSVVANFEGFDFATNAALASGYMEQDDGTGLIEAGQFARQDPAAFNLATLAGDWVFGVVGDDGAKNRLVIVGRLTLDTGGNISGAMVDSNATTPVVAGTMSGTLSAPDTNGRSTATLTIGSQSLPVAFYVVDQNTLFVATSDSSTTTPRIAGRMTRQTGAGTLDITAFANPAVLSMWGSSLVSGYPAATMTAGRLSAAAGGTVSVELDIVDRGAQDVNQIVTAQPYTVTANGRGTLTVASGGTAPRNFVLYADGAGGGYLIEPASVMGNFGILEQQTGGPPFSDFSTAYYLGASMYPGAASPISLAPQLLFQAGSIGGNLTGSYALDPTNGRMIAAVSRTILGGSDLIIYIVSPTKLVSVGDSLNISNSTLAWFNAY
jgi:hypothetical protein